MKKETEEDFRIRRAAEVLAVYREEATTKRRELHAADERVRGAKEKYEALFVAREKRIWDARGTSGAV